jgi:sec-independent protein translocase protein TatB
MFDIGFPELVLIAIVGLLVIGPERLPETLRTLGLWLGRMRRSFTTVKAEIEKEIGMDEVKRQLHNESIMDEMKRIEAEVKNTASTVQASINDGVKAMDSSLDTSSLKTSSLDTSSLDTTGIDTPIIDPAGADPAAGFNPAAGAQPGGTHVDIADTIAAQDNVVPARKDLPVSKDATTTNDALEKVEQVAGSQVEQAQVEIPLPAQSQESIAVADEKARNV